MAVGAQNGLGGQQTFARKMSWCIAFLCQNWDGFFCPNWGVLQKKKKKKKKKGLPLKFERFFCPNEGVLLKKKKTKKTKKVFTETETVFWQWCAQISTLFAQINRPFARIFDVLNRMGGRPPPLPPRLLRLWISHSIVGKWPSKNRGTRNASKGVRRGGVCGSTPPPNGPSTKMHNKEKITFLALLRLFFLQWHGLPHNLKPLLKHLRVSSGREGLICQR